MSAQHTAVLSTIGAALFSAHCLPFLPTDNTSIRSTDNRALYTTNTPANLSAI